MKNQLFDLKKTGERERKLRAVLKTCAGGALDADEIERIVKRVSSHRQYSIVLYDDPELYTQAVGYSGQNLPRPVREHRPMTVVAWRNRDGSGEPGRECVIHIFMPAKGEITGEQGL